MTDFEYIGILMMAGGGIGLLQGIFLIAGGRGEPALLLIFAIVHLANAILGYFVKNEVRTAMVPALIVNTSLIPLRASILRTIDFTEGPFLVLLLVLSIWLFLKIRK